MLKFDLEDLNPGKWFFFDKADETAGVCLRVAPAAEIRRIEKKCTTKGKGMDQEAFDAALWDYCITDWRGIADAAGEPIECTAATKAVLMGGAPDFSGFVLQSLAELRERKLDDRDLEKN